ncbi:MAG: LysM peptidoglycan-binding domain-containing protein [Anaerolineae bacterium]|nr:LysM peptidoglycan-binding domain-containing protein [Anaerolineae bacterium]
MRRIRTSFVIWALIALFLVALPIQAQGTNLLTNPGFEGQFITIGGDSTVQVATGWSPWHVSGGGSSSENVQPEYYAASNVTAGLGVPRIRNGSDAQQYHTFFATHDGGIFQRVTGVQSGATLEFRVFIYVWSSKFEDVNKSEEPGGVVAQVGIDPTGGTDGQSANIVWSAPVIQYDAYNEYIVTTPASGTAVTVFVRTTGTEPVKSSNIYVDDASLVVAGSSQPPSATPTLTNTPFVPTFTPTVTSTQVPPPSATPDDLGIVTPVTPPTVEVPSITPPDTFTPTLTFTPSATPTLTLTPQPSFTPTPTAEVLEITNTFTPTVTTPPADGFLNNIVHIVQRGDTVGELARLYGSTIDAIISKNGLNESALIQVGQSLLIPVRLPPPMTSTPSPTPIVSNPVTSVPPVQQPGSYVVQPGDTLYRIALRFNTTATTLAQLNGITNPNVIRVGQQLIVPGAGSGTGPVVVVTVVVQPSAVPTVTVPNTYVVRPGDTLYRISLRTGVPLGQLIQVNRIIDPNRLFVGQVLTIP